MKPKHNTQVGSGCPGCWLQYIAYISTRDPNHIKGDVPGHLSDIPA